MLRWLSSSAVDQSTHTHCLTVRRNVLLTTVELALTLRLFVSLNRQSISSNWVSLALTLPLELGNSTVGVYFFLSYYNQCGIRLLLLTDWMVSPSLSLLAVDSSAAPTIAAKETRAQMQNRDTQRKRKMKRDVSQERCSVSLYAPTPSHWVRVWRYSVGLQVE